MALRNTRRSGKFMFTGRQTIDSQKEFSTTDLEGREI
jgi:hypothetical protein